MTEEDNRPRGLKLPATPGAKCRICGKEIHTHDEARECLRELVKRGLGGRRRD